MNQETQYIGEHLLPGLLGHIFVILSFTAILFSTYSYYRHTKDNNTSGSSLSWNTLGRIGFGVHSLSILGLIGMLFYVMINQYYEYAYVYEHVSNELPMRYIFSAFWEGQEGSFLLWMFWHIILGFILIKTAGKWESSTLLFLGLAQLIINSMILGIHVGFGDSLFKFGSNPTLLLRNVVDAEIFQTADYLASIEGSGLNPLLQNYWMTIHPPTLFLGFASVTIPFCFAAAGLYTKQYIEWLAPCLKWSLFSAGILGIGILMGGAWAYEALTFGGYWAWDPVENMSLVPWLIMVAGVHANLIARSTGRAIKSTFIYYALSFVLILYSTYLTRSGVLGDTSVHAFTEMGLEPQLIFLVLFFLVLSTVLYFLRQKDIPVIKKEESIYSREFWMFVGALVLLFSGLIIAFSTSLPVFNSIMTYFDPNFTGKVIQDPIPHYNKFQIWIALLIACLSSEAIFMRYKTEEWSSNQLKKFATRILTYVLIASGLYAVMILKYDMREWRYSILAISALFSIVANGAYLIERIKFNPKLAGSVMGHAGFSIMVIGILISGLNESVITTNPFAMKGIIKDEDLAASVMLIKEEPFYVNGYWITYEGDTIVDKTRTFDIKFIKEDSTGVTQDSFHVYPNAMFSNDLTKIAAFNPGTNRRFTQDIFTRLTSLPKSQIDIKFAKEQEDTLKYIPYEVNIGDTLFTKEHYGIVEYVTFDPQHEDFLEHESDIGIGVGIRFSNIDKSEQETIEPALGLNENLLYQYAEKIDPLGLKVRLGDTTFDNFFTEEDELAYESYKVSKGEQFSYKDYNITLEGFNKNIVHNNYTPEPDDITVQTKLIVSKSDGSKTDTLEPLYIIRGNRPFSIKDYQIESGLHIRLNHIDPINELFEIQVAMDNRTDEAFVVEVADRIPRSDIINFEAKVFPGINLFWLGSCTMLLGFFVAYWHRYTTKNA